VKTVRPKEKIGTACRRTQWRGRPALFLANDRLALCFLLGGGHLASLSCRTGLASSVNLLWEANWRTIDPQEYSQRAHGRKFGPPPAGQFLSGFTGHALCLGYFGAPSNEESKLGLPLHGEAASSGWTVAEQRTSRHTAAVKLRITCPVAGLKIERDISLRSGESVAHVQETLTNQQILDTYFQWVQHVTFGPPLLSAGESACLVPGSRSKTWPLGYEGKCALKNNSEFPWPSAPGNDGAPLDLTQPFVREGRGFVAATLLDLNSETGYVVVLNWRLGLVAGYLFRRNDFPWVAIWEENRARTGPPWNGKTQARGVEFGTSPMPLGLRNAIEAGPVFGVPTVRCLPARSQLKASYAIFVAEAPPDWRTISGITTSADSITIAGPDPKQPIVLQAAGIGELKSCQQEQQATHAAAH
jgi:hypothetical protein